jgi:PmbA protein
MTNNNPFLHQQLNNLLDYAKKQGATAAEAELTTETGLSVTVRLGETETIEHQTSQHAVITVYFGQRTGSASCTDFTENSLHLAADKACTIARFTAEDDCTGLADPFLMATASLDLDLYHPWKLTVQQAIEIALACEQLARKEDRRITNSEGVTLNTGEAYFIYGNTHGFRGFYPTTQHNLTCSLIATQNGDMQRDYDYTVACDPKELDDVALLAQRTAERTVRRLGARQLVTQNCPIIFSAEVARTFWGHFLAAITGGNLYRKSSFLVDKLEHKIFPELVQITEMPHLKRKLGSTPFDSEGVATHTKDLVRDGIVKNYLLGSYSARKLGMQSTGNANGTHNVLVKSGEHDLAGLLKLMDKGLLVTELIGQGVNLVTGDYSRGAFGFWVERGQIQFPVHEITIAGNLADMFQQVAAIGCDADKRGNIQTGSVLIENMTVAGRNAY